MTSLPVLWQYVECALLESFLHTHPLPSYNCSYPAFPFLCIFDECQSDVLWPLSKRLFNDTCEPICVLLEMHLSLSTHRFFVRCNNVSVCMLTVFGCLFINSMQCAFACVCSRITVFIKITDDTLLKQCIYIFGV